MDHSSHVLAPRPLALPGLRSPFAQVSARDFWRQHAWWPLLAFVLAFGSVEVFSLDRVFATEWFFNVHSGEWLGAGAGDWWARGLLHTGGGWLVRAIGALALIIWALSFGVERLRDWRRTAGFVVLAMALSTGIVGILKAVTNVDCPWDLIGFGGHNPYVALFADRPDALPHAKCFPGAHSSSGFALVCFYFVLRDRWARLARWALAGAILVGVAFSIGQEARGAHFLSHDLTSAGLVWFAQLGLYAWMFGRARARVTKPVTVSVS
jgi:membrane-associated PAP2 superfamily phosphatase